MALTTKTQDQVSLKLLVNKDTNKVLFAEAGKDFVDVLFSFLTFPLGTIARLVGKKSDMGPVTVGCLNKLYQSVINLDEECLKSDECKEILLQPTNSSENYCNSLKLNIDDTEPAKYFLCSNYDEDSSFDDDDYDVYSWSLYLHASRDKECKCGNNYTRSVPMKHSGRKGFVNRCSSFVITDNLAVMPNSMQFTSLGLLKNLEINGASSLKELTVNVTKNKILDMLKCSLLSETTLTDLFLRKKPSLESYKFFPCHLENRRNIQIKVKLVMRKSDGKVLYAQGEQDFADLLLSFLSFPLGAVVRVLGGNCSIGNIDSLYKSIVDLDDNKYLVSKEAKIRLVDPHLAPLFKFSHQILPVENANMHYYCFYEIDDKDASIKFDKFLISDKKRGDWGGYKNLKVESQRASYEGYVEGPRAYMATDDLVLTPWSPISAIHLIDHFQIPLTDLKEKLVTIGVKECLSILKASLISTSALTNGLSHLLTEVKQEIVKNKLKTEVKEEANKKPKLTRRL